MIETYCQPLAHGIILSCRATGERGRPVLMFLHGFPEAAFVWDFLLEHFSRAENGGYRCVAPNLRGFEHSSAPANVSAYQPKQLVQDIAALIALEAQHQGGQLACLVAHDWGGAVAWRLANQLPHLTRQLVIINSPHPGTFLRELKNSPAQQAASAYMNFLIRPDAEQLLAQHDYLCAGRFTMADISVGYALRLAQFLDLEAEFPAPVRRYWERLQQRDGYQRACAAEVAAALAQGVSAVPAPAVS